MKKIYRVVLTLSLLSLMMSSRAQAASGEVQRWYRTSQVEQGQLIFEKNCIFCHRKNATGTPDWKKPLPDGSYPPPPLNGTAHAWHHPLKVLKQVIEQGSVARGGQMPSFKDRLSEAEREAVLAYVQNFWNDKIYRMWQQGRHKMNR